MLADGSAVLELMDEIGAWGYRVNNFSTALESVKDASHVTLRINSPGGEVVEAFAIADLIRNSGKTVHAEVYGMCASAATLIALACDEVHMAENARWMVHEPQFGLSGTLAELENMLPTFTTLRADIYNIYATRTGKTAEQLMADHEQDRWYTAKEALDYGWVNGIIGHANQTEEEPAADTDEPTDEPSPGSEIVPEPEEAGDEDDTEDEATDDDEVSTDTEPARKPSACARLLALLGLRSAHQRTADRLAYWQERARKAEAGVEGFRAVAAAARRDARALSLSINERINTAVAGALASLGQGAELPAPSAALPARASLALADIARADGVDAAIAAHASVVTH